jgi:hypothetical protein
MSRRRFPGDEPPGDRCCKRWIIVDAALPQEFAQTPPDGVNPLGR